MTKINRNIGLTLLLLAMSGIVSCKNDIPEIFPINSTETPVCIQTTIGDGNWNELSRADITYNGVAVDQFKPDHKIGVFGYYLPNGKELEEGDVADFMNNQLMTYDGTKWNYSPVKYWPNNHGDRVAFWAYYPYNMPNVTPTYNLATRQPEIVFPNDTYYYNDVMVAEMVTSDKMAVNGGVPLVFRHILSKVKMIIKFNSFKETDSNGNTVQNIPDPTLKIKDAKYWDIPIAGTFKGFDADKNPIWQDITYSTDVNTMWVDHAIYELKPGEEVFIDQDFTFFIPFYVDHLSFVPLIVAGDGATVNHKYSDDDGVGNYDEANFALVDNNNDEFPDPTEFDFYLSKRGFGEKGLYLAPGTETTIRINVGLYGIDNVEVNQRPIAKWDQTSHTDVYY